MCFLYIYLPQLKKWCCPKRNDYSVCCKHLKILSHFVINKYCYFYQLVIYPVWFVMVVSSEGVFVFFQNGWKYLDTKLVIIITCHSKNLKVKKEQIKIPKEQRGGFFYIYTIYTGRYFNFLHISGRFLKSYEIYRPHCLHQQVLQQKKRGKKYANIFSIIWSCCCREYVRYESPLN